MVRGHFAALMQICVFSLDFEYPNGHYTSLDSHMWMPSNDLKYENVPFKVEIHRTWELNNFNFQYIFLKWIFSAIHGANFTKFGTCIVEGHSEGSVSQIFYLGPSFYFMKCRKLSCKKSQKVSRFLT